MIKDEEINVHNLKIIEQLRPINPQKEQCAEKNSIIALPHTPMTEPKPHPKSEKSAVDVTQQEMKLLMDIYSNPWIGVLDRYKKLDLSAGAGSRATESLIKKGLVSPHDIRATAKGRATRFLEISSKGYLILNMPSLSYGRGSGFVHYCIQNLITRHIKKLSDVNNVEIEGSIASKNIDVLVRMQDGKYIAIEVAMESANERSNATKDLEAGCKTVIVVCENPKVLANVKQILTSIDSDGRQTSAASLPQTLKCKNLEELLRR